MRNRMFVGFLCLVLLLSLFAGCTGGSEPAAAAAPAGADAPAADGGLEDATITLLTRSFNDNTTVINRVMLEELNAWKEMNPNIEVVDESVHDEDQFNNKVKIAVSSGDMPTFLSSYGGGAFQAYVEGGLILDLTPYMEQHKDFFGSLTDAAFSTQVFPGIEGTYGWSMDMFATGIFYNKTIFEENGLTVPKTISEFEAVCDALVAAGITPMPLGDKNNYLGAHLSGDVMMKRFGSEIMTQLSTREKKYTDPEMLEIFTLLNSWNEKGYLGDSVVTMDQDMARIMFKTGKSAMLHQLVHQYGPIMNEEATITDEEVGFMTFPQFDGVTGHENAFHSGTNNNYSLSAEASEAEIQAVLDLSKFIFRQEAMQAMVNEGAGSIICTRSDVTMPTDLPPACQEFSEAYALANDWGKEAGEYDTNPAIRNLLRDSIQGMFAGTSPEDSAAKVQAGIDQQ